MVIGWRLTLHVSSQGKSTLQRKDRTTKRYFLPLQLLSLLGLRVGRLNEVERYRQSQ